MCQEFRELGEEVYRNEANAQAVTVSTAAGRAVDAGAGLVGCFQDRADGKKALAKILHALETQDLTPEFRAELQSHAATLIAALDYTWLPNTWLGRACALAIVLLGVQHAWVGNYQPLVWCLLLPLLSPRIRRDAAYWRRKYWG